MKESKVIAKHDLEAKPHTWTKGLDYELIEKEHHFTLTSNKGQVNYKNNVKENVLDNFKNELYMKKYAEAMQMYNHLGSEKTTVSVLQRYLRIGYKFAKELLDDIREVGE